MDSPLAHIDAERAAGAFGVLADPVRVEILCALKRNPGASFSTLQEAAGVADSGRFNYHLDKLTGHFVRNAADGYKLRPAGLRALNIAASGGFTDSSSFGPVSLSADCPECDTGLRAEYGDGWLYIECPACDVVPHFSTFPPRGIPPRDTDAFLRAYSAWIRRHFSLATEGVCPYCGGSVIRSLDFDPDWYLDVAALSDCESCGSHIGTPVGLRLLDRPSVVAFLHQRGVDPQQTPFWQFDWCLSAAGISVESEEPRRVIQTITRDGDELRVTVDDSLAVVREERVLRS